jgi:hypothetical protein
MGRLRHLAVRHLWGQEELESGRVVAIKVKGTENKADVGTKYLDGPAFNKCRSELGVRALSAAVIAQLPGCARAANDDHLEMLSSSAMIGISMIFMAGFLLGACVACACSRTTSTVAPKEKNEKTIAGKTLDARFPPTVAWPVGDMWFPQLARGGIWTRSAEACARPVPFTRSLLARSVLEGLQITDVAKLRYDGATDENFELVVKTEV